jgi:hypothetical protein
VDPSSTRIREIFLNPKEAWRIEHEKIESMYKSEVEHIFIGHHAEFLRQYCKLRRDMKKPGEDIPEIKHRIEETYSIALKKANEWLSREPSS